MSYLRPRGFLHRSNCLPVSLLFDFSAATHGFELVVVVCPGVVWPCVVWCGVAWRGVVWRGVVWRGVVWRGVVWCGVVWYVMVWYGMICYGMGGVNTDQHGRELGAYV